MHYRNGREAKPGDQVVLISDKFAVPVTGVLHSIVPGSQSCNARLALLSPNDPHVTIGNCLHLDDVLAASVPDATKQNVVIAKAE